MGRLKASLRDIISSLQKEGVQTRAIWGLIHEQLPYQDDIAYRIDRAKYYGSCIVNIPCSTQLTEDEIMFVVRKIKDILGGMTDESGIT